MSALDFIAALPVSAAADKALLRSAMTRRGAYCLSPSETLTTITIVDPADGSIPNYVIQNLTLFQYFSADGTTAHDGVTCLVSQDGKRFKTSSIAYPDSVLDKDTSAQPGSPSFGDAYLIPTAATGAQWAGKDGKVGIYTINGWFFATVPIGRPLYVQDEDATYHRATSGTWTAGVGNLVFGNDTISPLSVIGRGTTWKVQNQTTNTPPGSAAVGVQYIIGPSPTGAWSGHAGKLAICLVTNVLTVVTPEEGERAWDRALDDWFTFNGTTWVAGDGVWLPIYRANFSAAATIDLVHGTNGIILDGTYDKYKVEFPTLKVSANDSELWLRVATAGPTWQTAGYYHTIHILGSQATVATGSGSDSKMLLTQGTGSTLGISNGAGALAHGRIEFNNPASSDFKEIVSEFSYSAANATARYVKSICRWNTAGALVGLRAMFNGAVTGTGRVKLYGMKV